MDNDERNSTALLVQLKTFLEEWPLYRKFSFNGAGTVDSYDGGRSFPMPTKTTKLAFPLMIQSYCDSQSCQARQLWECGLASRYSNWESSLPLKADPGFYDVDYVCRNCGKSTVRFFLYITADSSHVEITKIGQWPPQSREPDPVVVKAWDATDLELYRKALTLRNAGWGIGSLPYLRRVIENHIHEILDLIAESIKSDAPPNAEALLRDLSGVRTGLRFADKLDFARDHLPYGLTPKDAPNPIGMLYILISDGIHAKTDSECIEIFDDCKAAFEFVIKRLSEAKRENEVYIHAVRKIEERAERGKSKSS